MRYLSLFSGIEAATVAWHRLGWEPAAFAEVEPFCCEVLKHHYPTVPNLGDVSKITSEMIDDLGPIDLIVGGSPCQAFSVAGHRKSLADRRGNLTLEYLRICDLVPDALVLWENVPGVFSTKDNAFGCFLGGMVGADDALVPPGKGKWGNAGVVVGPRRAAVWRVLDAQFFGVPQRRRRVFLLAGRVGAERLAEVLLEPASLRGDPPAGGPTREEVAGTLGGSSQDGGFRTTDLDNVGAFVVNGKPVPPSQALAVNLRGRAEGNVPEVSDKASVRASSGGSSRSFVCAEVAGTLQNSGKAAGSATQQDVESGLLVAEPLAFRPIAGATRSIDAGPTSPTLKVGCHGSAGHQVAVVNIEHGLAAHGSLELRATAEEVGRAEFKGHTAVIQPVAFSSKASHFTRGKDGAPAGVTPPLSADADRGDQDPLVLAPVPIDLRQAARGEKDTNNRADGGAPGTGIGGEGDPGFSVTARGQAVAFNIVPASGQGADLQASPTDLAMAITASEHTKLLDRGTRIVQADPLVFDHNQITCPDNRSQPAPGKPCHTLARDNAARALVAQGVDIYNARLNGEVAGTVAHNQVKQTSGQGVLFAPEVADPLRSTSDSPAAHNKRNGTDRDTLVACDPYNGTVSGPGEPAPTLSTESQFAGSRTGPALIEQVRMIVRRLTPVECARLQGFPDRYLDIVFKKKPAADSSKYKALGNSMATVVMFWIGRRIDAYLWREP